MLDPVKAADVDSASTQQGRLPVLRHYVDIARRRKAVIFLCVALGLAGSVALTLHKKNLYQGGAQVVLSRQNLANALTGTPDPTAQANDFLRVVQTQADIARSPDVAERVVKAVPEAGLTFKQFLATSDVKTQQAYVILRFTAENSDPALATKHASV
jgi:capsular polysaccharide biosynthesis protein